jgi:hypothetical protein
MGTKLEKGERETIIFGTKLEEGERERKGASGWMG